MFSPRKRKLETEKQSFDFQKILDFLHNRQFIRLRHRRRRNEAGGMFDNSYFNNFFGFISTTQTSGPQLRSITIDNSSVYVIGGDESNSKGCGHCLGKTFP
jgi:hypothetical protein